MLPKVGILGAGKLGITVAQLALKAGYQVYIAGSKGAEAISLTVRTLTPGAVAVDAEELAEKVDLIVLAIPLSKYKNIPKSKLSGKLVVDAMNHWPEVDGPRSETISPEMSSSEVVQGFLPESRVVKAINHVGYHDLHDSPRNLGHPERKAIAIAGDGTDEVAAVANFISAIGFDTLHIGALSAGRALEPGNPAFGANESTEALKRLIL